MGRLLSSMRHWVDLTARRFRERGRAGIAWALRLTAAAVIAYVVASLVFPRSEPLLAPLSALLVVQLTPVSILTSGVKRVIAVVAGVSVAVLLSSLLSITWWSLATVVVLSLAVGQALRLGPDLLEVPISAMLILGVGSRSAETAAWKRIVETLIGAGVGVVSNLVLPPRVRTSDAAEAIEELGSSLARLLDAAAVDLTDADLSTDQLASRARDRLGEVRRVTHDIPNVGQALLRAEESYRLNLRALGTDDVRPLLRHGLEALEHSAVALRGLHRSLADALTALHEREQRLPGQQRDAVTGLLHDLAGLTAAFGALVSAGSGTEAEAQQVDTTETALAHLRESRSRLAPTLQVDAREDLVLATLGTSLLATVDRVAAELDVETHRSQGVPRPDTLPHRLVATARDPKTLATLPRRMRRPDGADSDESAVRRD